eukprot:67249-Chlamydomonas_euryale.AAC.1
MGVAVVKSIISQIRRRRQLVANSPPGTTSALEQPPPPGTSPWNNLRPSPDACAMPPRKRKHPK